MSGETNINIIYDVVGKGVFVEFNGRSHYLQGPFTDKKKAIEAVMLFCKSSGWPSDSENREMRDD